VYYQHTYSNGQIWIQDLAALQGITYDPNKNPSDEWHDSSILLTEVNSFSAADAGTALFIVWVADADFVDDMTQIYPSLNTTTWNNAISASLANQSSAITTLYNKGARTLVMPNAVDISKIPEYAYDFGVPPSDQSFIRGRVSYFNSGFTTMLNTAMANHPGLKIYTPDMFSLLDNMLANPGNYGLVNPGYSALDDQSLKPWSLTGPGANYVFWDPWDPTAKAHAVMANVANQLIPLPPPASPAKIKQFLYGNPCTISGTGPVSHPFALISSTNAAKALNLWTWEQTNTAGTGSFSFSVSPGTAQAKFFRVVTQ